MNANVMEIIACPACKGGLTERRDTLTCTRCSVDYPIIEGVPRLYPPDNRVTINPADLRIKNSAEAARTVADMRRMDSGVITKPRRFYLIYLLLLVALVFRSYPTILLLTTVLLVDWLVFRWRRGRTLARFMASPIRLRSVSDHEAIDQLYRREGKTQPTMSDWVRLAREAAGAAGTADSHDHDDERYIDIRRVYTQTSDLSRVVVDIGANDGRAHFEFGIGKDKTFIGVDVSHLLLKDFLAHIPDQTALQADGVCLPFKDSSVDFLFCTETLEHVSDPGRAVREFVRVLRPGGRLMIQSPNAHRIRNLNILDVMALLTSLATDRVLQKKVLHENTWHNGVTYHWDFSVQDYRRLARDAGARILELRSREFFWPDFLLGGRQDAVRRKEKLIGSIPLVRFFGGDLVMVAEKTP